MLKTLNMLSDAMQIRTWIGKFHHSPTAVQDLPPTARQAQADVSSHTMPFSVSCFCFFPFNFLCIHGQSPLSLLS